MAESNIIQMHDYAGNNQYPVTLASLVYDEDGETVGKKLALLLDWFEWGDEKKTSVKTKYPFWSEKQLSAGGIGGEGGSGEGGIGTITGIKVNGVTYNEPDEFGVLTIPNYPTSLEWADIAGRPTHLSQFTDDVVAGKYLPTSGGTIESTGIPLTIKRTDNPYSVISFYGIEDGTSQHFGYLGFAGVGEPIYMTSNGSGRILIHSGNVGEYNAGSATKLQTPRTIWGQSFDGTGNVTAPPTMPYVYFANQYSEDRIGYIGKGAPNENTIYIAGLKDDGRIYLFTGTGDAAHSIILNSTGNVLLGTVVDEGYKLDVRGSTLITSSDGLYGVKIASAGNTIDAYTSYSEIANLYINHHTSGNVYIATGGGNVGIGTNNPNAKLQVAGDVNIVGYRLYWGESDYYSIGSESDNSSIPPHLAYRGYNGHRFHNSYGEAMRINEHGQVGIGTESPDEMLHVAGNIRLKNTTNFGCFLKFGDGDCCYLYEDSDDHLNIYARQGIALLTNGNGVTTDTSLTIGSAVLSWDSVNNALKIEGNVYTTGQLSAGGVGTEVQKVFDIAATSNTTVANLPYTASLTHNLNTYDLAVVVYEVTENATTETLTQVLADVTLTDENNVTVYFASRKIDKKYRIVIIG